MLFLVQEPIPYGAMLTGSVTRNFQNSRYFRWPAWKTKSW